MSNRKFPDDVKIGDRVCFKSNEEKEKYVAATGYILPEHIYGKVIYDYGNTIRLSFFNHKGICVGEEKKVNKYRLKFYDEQ